LTYDTKQFETLDYKPKRDKNGKVGHPYSYLSTPASTPPATLGMNSHVIKPETRVNKAEGTDQPIRSLEEAKAVAQEYFKTSEQPKTNQLIIEQAEGAIKVTLELLNQLEPYNTDQRGDKQCCIWTLEGWLNNNLKHLKNGFE